MSHHHPRRILTPGASRKRKEMDAFYTVKPSTLPVKAPSASASTTSSKAAEPVSSNQLLAGYMAYEFLNKGTVLGQKWDPARAEAVPLSGRAKPSQRAEAEPTTRGKPRSYSDVASLLKTDGAHIPGIVNPTQLARWIQM